MSLDVLKEYLNRKKIEISSLQEQQFERYAALLSERNKVMNLTAVSEGRETEIRHFIDSLAMLGELPVGECRPELLHNQKIIDIGTGAGFPGIPLSIMLPDNHFTLVDSLQKRIGFLKEVCQELGLINVEPVCGRFEELARNPEYREGFDLAVSRAVADLRVLIEYTIPFLMTDGLFVSYKSSEAEIEVKCAEKALRELKSSVSGLYKYNEYDSDISRTLVLICKNGSVSEKYPRRNGIPSKRPL